MELLLDTVKDYVTKLWRSKATGGFQPQRLRVNDYLALALRR